MILFYILVFTLTIPNHPVLAHHVGPITVLKCLGIACLVGASLEMLRTNSRRLLSRLVTSRWLLMYFFVALTSCLVRDRTLAFGSDPFMYTVSTFSLFVITTTMVSTSHRLRWTVLTVLASAGWGSLYVIRQWQQYHNAFPGFRTWGGLAGDPNYYAVTVVLSMPLMVVWLMAKGSKWRKWFCIGCLIVSLVGFIFVASRGGFIGLSVGLLFLIWNTRRRLRNLALVSLLMIAVIFAPGESAFSRLLRPTESDQESSQFRLELWKAAENTFLEHPLFGVGMGHYHPTIVREGAVIDLPFHVAHNTYVGLLADLGLAGIIPFLGALFSAFANLRRTARRSKASGQLLLHQVAMGLQAGLLGYIVCAFFLSTQWQQVMWLVVFLSMCLPRIQKLTLAKQEIELIPQAEEDSFA